MLSEHVDPENPAEVTGPFITWPYKSHSTTVFSYCILLVKTFTQPHIVSRGGKVSSIFDGMNCQRIWGYILMPLYIYFSIYLCIYIAFPLLLSLTIYKSQTYSANSWLYKLKIKG
jgi:hypothetical protein